MKSKVANYERMNKENRPRSVRYWVLSNNPNKGRREDSMLGRGPTHNVLVTSVHMLSKQEREYFLELLKDDEF